MTFKVSPYSVTFLVVALVASVAAVFIWRKRHSPGGIPLFLMMLAVIEWNLCGFLEASVVPLANKIFWSKCIYLGAHTTPGWMLIFSLAYTGRKQWLTRRNVSLLFVIPVVTILLAATNEWHHLIWTDFTPGPAGTNSYIYNHGIWFWVATIYVNCILFLGTLVLLVFALRSKERYRNQTIAIVIAILLPWLAFVIYLSGLNPFPGLDLTAIAFGITGSILAWIILRWQFLDVIPVARETLIEEMSDGMLVLDTQNRIVDINTAAKRLFGLETSHLIGQKVSAVLPDWPDITHHLVRDSSSQDTVVIQSAESQYIGIRVTPLQKDGKPTGSLVIVRDITSRKQAEQALLQTNQVLTEKLGEIEKLQQQLRDQSLHDPLTALFNRRFLEETMAKELARAKRGNYSVGAMMIDIDHFKQFNDTYGHSGGDEVLIALANFLLSKVRQSDTIYRYGGEEFLIIMPGIQLEEIRSRAEFLCHGFAALPIKYGTFELHTTISIGVAVYPQHSDDLQGIIKAADDAMYEAKRAGRNRVFVWGTP